MVRGILKVDFFLIGDSLRCQTCVSLQLPCPYVKTTIDSELAAIQVSNIETLWAILCMYYNNPWGWLERFDDAGGNLSLLRLFGRFAPARAPLARGNFDISASKGIMYTRPYSRTFI